MNVYLKNTSMDRFVHHLYNGEQVVRNPKLNALIETKLTDIDPMYRRILATPQFHGGIGNEQIDWYTDQFSSTPKSLSSLSGESRAHYKALLDQVMQQFAEAIQAQPESIRELLGQAVTYHSLDNVFCADDKIVLTEWGMHHKDKGKWVNILGVDYDGEEKPMPIAGPEEEKPADAKVDEQKDMKVDEQVGVKTPTQADVPPVVPPVVPPGPGPASTNETGPQSNVIGETSEKPHVGSTGATTERETQQ